MNEAKATMIALLPRGRERMVAVAAGFMRWLRAHRGAVTMSGLLSFAAPVTFFSGAVSVMREPTAVDVLVLTAWFVLFGVELWGLLLVIGYVCNTSRQPVGTLAAQCCLARARPPR